MEIAFDLNEINVYLESKKIEQKVLGWNKLQMS